MAFNDLKFIGFLKTKMNWHQARQRLLAQNVANADTPSYRGRDLKPMAFGEALGLQGLDKVAQARTNASHIRGPLIASSSAGHASRQQDGWEVTPEGNAVVLEEEMMKVAANQFDYQLASSLYSRSLGLIRTALGRNG